MLFLLLDKFKYNYATIIDLLVVVFSFYLNIFILGYTFSPKPWKTVLCTLFIAKDVFVLIRSLFRAGLDFSDASSLLMSYMN